MIWTCLNSAKALRDNQGIIMRQWQKTLQTELWHLNRELYSRKGTAHTAALEMLSALVSCHENAGAALAQAERDLVNPESSGQSAEAQVTPDTAVRQLAYTDSLGSAAHLFSELPLHWPDVQRMLGYLEDETRLVLQARGADAPALHTNDGYCAFVIAAVADRRIRQCELELAGYQDEAVTTQHVAGRFLSNASHELRTPLTAILGFTELLMEESYGVIVPLQAQALAHIENSAQNLLECINNLLDLLSIRAGKLTLQYILVDVTPLLQELYSTLRPLAERKKVEFPFILAEDLGQIEADKSIFRHIIYHLLSSSLRATPAGGCVEVSAWRDASSIVVEARDTALHIPPEAIANMGAAFPLLENSPARGYEGWEVGLPLVRRYLDLHQGELQMESLPDSGTIFRVVIPIARPAEAKEVREN